jgi:hypothetical protein
MGSPPSERRHTSPSRGGRRAKRAGWGLSPVLGGLNPPGSSGRWPAEPPSPSRGGMKILHRPASLPMKMRSPARGERGFWFLAGTVMGGSPSRPLSYTAEVADCPSKPRKFDTTLKRSPGQGGRPGLPYQRGDRRERSPRLRIARTASSCPGEVPGIQLWLSAVRFGSADSALDCRARWLRPSDSPSAQGCGRSSAWPLPPRLLFAAPWC